LIEDKRSALAIANENVQAQVGIDLR